MFISGAPLAASRRWRLCIPTRSVRLASIDVDFDKECIHEGFGPPFPSAGSPVSSAAHALRISPSSSLRGARPYHCLHAAARASSSLAAATLIVTATSACVTFHHVRLRAFIAGVERDLISERTREGLARARASGKKLGRPKGSLGVSRLDGKEDEIRRFLKLGVSKSAIAEITGVSRPTLDHFLGTRGLSPTP